MALTSRKDTVDACRSGPWLLCPGWVLYPQAAPGQARLPSWRAGRLSFPGLCVGQSDSTQMGWSSIDLSIPSTSGGIYKIPALHQAPGSRETCSVENKADKDPVPVGFVV